MGEIKHFFVNSHSLEDEITAGNFEQLGLKVLEAEFQLNDVIVLTGGSGMFIDALCNGLDKIPTDASIREELQKELNANGLDPLLAELEENDREYYQKVDRQNPMRILRALEVTRSTGKTFSSYRKSKPDPRPFKVHRFAINHDREFLYNRINLRVDLMMEAGLLDEVKSVLEYRHLTSMNTVGYRELFSHLDGDTTLEEAKDAIKQNSRRYAKRQITWIKRHPETEWINWTDIPNMTSEVVTKFTKLRNLE